jgi:hypothetical protein
MRPQDVGVVVYLLQQELSNRSWQGKDIAAALELSPAEVSNSISRNVQAGLLSQSKRVNRLALYDFLECGLRYVYPPVLGGMTVGLPTGSAVSPFKDELIVNEPFVWPDIEGKQRGVALEPIYPTFPHVARENTVFHTVMAAADLFRVGSARERLAAKRYLKTLFFEEAEKRND